MIQKALAAFLLADKSITDVVGTRVYPQQAPQGAAYPRIDMTRIDTSFGHHYQGPDGLPGARIQITCRSMKTGEANDLADRVRRSQGGDTTAAMLDGFRGQMGGYFVAGCFARDQRDEDDEPQDGTETGPRQASVDLEIRFNEQIHAV